MVMVMVGMGLAAMESVVPAPTPGRLGRLGHYGSGREIRMPLRSRDASNGREEIRKTGEKIALPSSAG